MSNYHIDTWEISSRKLLPTTPKFKNKLSPMSPLVAIAQVKWAPAPFKGNVLLSLSVWS